MISNKEVESAARHKRKMVEGSKGEESLESPKVERVEDYHEEAVQIKPGSDRHNSLQSLWGASSKSGGKNLSPKPGSVKKHEFLNPNSKK